MFFFAPNRNIRTDRKLLVPGYLKKVTDALQDHVIDARHGIPAINKGMIGMCPGELFVNMRVPSRPQLDHVNPVVPPSMPFCPSAYGQQGVCARFLSNHMPLIIRSSSWRLRVASSDIETLSGAHLVPRQIWGFSAPSRRLFCHGASLASGGPLRIKDAL